MMVQLLVERDQNECIVKLAGTAYKFKRNEYGHLVSDITDQDHIKWVSDPTHNTSFKIYSAPKKKIIEEVTDEVAPAADSPKSSPESVESRMSAHFGNEMPMHDQVGKGAYAPYTGQADTNDEPDLPAYPKKGSKRPPKRRED
jgi:hypothetical protein